MYLIVFIYQWLPIIKIQVRFLTLPITNHEFLNTMDWHYLDLKILLIPMLSPSTLVRVENWIGLSALQMKEQYSNLETQRPIIVFDWSMVIWPTVVTWGLSIDLSFSKCGVFLFVFMPNRCQFIVLELYPQSYTTKLLISSSLITLFLSYLQCI